MFSDNWHYLEKLYWFAIFIYRTSSITNFYGYVKEVRKKTQKQHSYDSLQKLQVLRFKNFFLVCFWVAKPATLLRILSIRFTQTKLILEIIECRKMPISQPSRTHIELAFIPFSVTFNCLYFVSETFLLHFSTSSSSGR